jgi:hypothetical protein
LPATTRTARPTMSASTGTSTTGTAPRDGRSPAMPACRGRYTAARRGREAGPGASGVVSAGFARQAWLSCTRGVGG